MIYGEIRVEEKNGRMYAYDKNGRRVCDGEIELVRMMLLQMGYTEHDLIPREQP